MTGQPTRHQVAAACVLARAMMRGSEREPAPVFLDTLALMEDGLIPELVVGAIRELAHEGGLLVEDEPIEPQLGQPLQRRISFRRA